MNKRRFTRLPEKSASNLGQGTGNHAQDESSRMGAEHRYSLAPHQNFVRTGSMDPPSMINRPGGSSVFSGNSRFLMEQNKMTPQVAASAGGVAALLNRQGLMGTSKGGGVGVQTPATQFRHNLGTGGERRLTFGMGMMSTVHRGEKVKDPRPLRDKEFQKRAAERIMTYLAEQGRGGIVTSNLFNNPTNKDFQNVFRFLYEKLDARYAYTKKFEEEVPVILRNIRYPFVDSISKSQLYAAGSVHAWPTILGMLLWMTEVCMIYDLIPNDPLEFSERMDANTERSAEQVEEAEMRKQNQAFFRYLVKSYPLWLENKEEPPEIEEELKAYFDEKNERLRHEVSKKEERIAELRKKVEENRGSERPLAQVQRKKQVLISDIQKFEMYIDRLERKIKRLREHVKEKGQEIEEGLRENAEQEQEIEKLKRIIDTQEISIVEANRLNQEKESLSVTLKGLQDKLKEVQERLWQKEVEYQRRIDRVENNQQIYINSVQQMDVDIEEYNIPIDTENILTISASQQGSGSNLKNNEVLMKVKTKLFRDKEILYSQIHKIETEIIKLREQRDLLGEQKTDMNYRLDELEKQVTKAQNKYLELRQLANMEIGQYCDTFDKLEDEIATYERQINKMESELATQSKKWKDKLTDLNKKYRESVAGYAREIQIVSEEINKMQQFIVEKANELDKEISTG